MLYLKYAGEDEKYVVDFKMMSSNVCQLLGNFPVKRIGFYLSRLNAEDNWNYLKFNTVFREISGGVQFSNDGTTYVEPQIPESAEEPEPYVPTIEDIKAEKITELSMISKEMITNGVDVEIDGEIEHFSYSDEDEKDINDTYNTVLLTGLGQSLHADGNGGNCKIYTPEQVVEIYITEKSNKMHHKTYFNQLKGYVNSLADEEIIKAVVYGQPLTGDYLNNYNENMDNAKLNIQVALQKAFAAISNTEEAS